MTRATWIDINLPHLVGSLVLKLAKPGRNTVELIEALAIGLGIAGMARTRELHRLTRHLLALLREQPPIEVCGMGCASKNHRNKEAGSEKKCP